jgi:hypothetical protein
MMMMMMMMTIIIMIIMEHAENKEDTLLQIVRLLLHKSNSTYFIQIVNNFKKHFKSKGMQIK